MTKFVCIGGKARNGKDTTARILCEELQAKGKRVLIAHYADLLKYMCKTFFGWNGEKDDVGRTLLQRVGTDVVRKKSPNYWVDYIVGVVSLFPDEWDYVIVADTRFPNELERIEKKGYDYTYVKVDRQNFVSPLTEEQQNHPSEIALDGVVPNYVIRNGGTLDDLRNKVCDLCNTLIERDTMCVQPEQIKFNLEGA